MSAPITHAVVLMAGTGSRLVAGGHVLPKPLIQIAGRSVFSYTIDALQKAGIRVVHAVTGYNSRGLVEGLKPLVPSGMSINRVYNSDWQKQNGISLLAAKPHVQAPFVLAMGDHLFGESIVDLAIRHADLTQLNAAFDRKIDTIFDLGDAMKIKSTNDRVIAIGKELADYDAIDTGLFICPAEFFDYLEREIGRASCRERV